MTVATLEGFSWEPNGRPSPLLFRVSLFRPEPRWAVPTLDPLSATGLTRHGVISRPILLALGPFGDDQELEEFTFTP